MAASPPAVFGALASRRKAQALLGAILLLAAGPALGDCREKFERLQFRENDLPYYRIVDDLLACMGLEQHVGELDRLDRDMLMMNAIHYSWEKFRGKEADIKEQAYGEFIPEDKLRSFYDFVQDHKAPERE